MRPSRRIFLGQSAAISGAFSGLFLMSNTASARSDGYINQVEGFGPLIRYTSSLFDLPAGFEYVTFSDTGEEMDDGLLVPGDHDGMACFPGPGDLITLVRNHELGPFESDLSAFGRNAERFDLIDSAKCYDVRWDGKPHSGGTTTVHFDPRNRTVVRQFLSLAGTEDNCAGGPTPWGSWITCEETRARAGQGGAKDHGYAFEVPADAQGLVTPVPLVHMGRFNREAVAVDPETLIVYQTEDDRPSLITRFIPDVPGDLTQPGRLQAMAILGQPGVNTNNWPDNPDRVEVGRPMSVEWVDVADPSNRDNRMAEHTISAGAASFTRGEGMWFGKGEVFFCCTDGGPEQIGQIWRYRPSPHEGQCREASAPGELALLVESTSRQILEKCDNITVAPWGDLIVVEDGDAEQYIRGVTPAGEVYTIGRNASPDRSGEYSEITGPCFSPDGSLLFFNVQNGPGRTFAVSGPWAQRSSAPV